jgi:uncharacterized protein
MGQRREDPEYQPSTRISPGCLGECFFGLNENEMLSELNENEIQEVLKMNSIGRIGCTDGVNVYIVPINYQYEQNAVLCYSLEGLKIDMMRNHPSVCFEVDEIKNSYQWKCVVVNGVFEEITDEEELDQLRPRYVEYMLRERASLLSLPETENKEPQNKINSDQVFYRIRFEKVSGRFESLYSYIKS